MNESGRYRFGETRDTKRMRKKEALARRRVKAATRHQLRQLHARRQQAHREKRWSDVQKLAENPGGAKKKANAPH